MFIRQRGIISLLVIKFLLILSDPAFRVLVRIADNFEDKPEEPANDLIKYNLLYPFKKISEKLKQID